MKLFVFVVLVVVLFVFVVEWFILVIDFDWLCVEGGFIVEVCIGIVISVKVIGMVVVIDVISVEV